MILFTGSSIYTFFVGQTTFVALIAHCGWPVFVVNAVVCHSLSLLNKAICPLRCSFTGTPVSTASNLSLAILLLLFLQTVFTFQIQGCPATMDTIILEKRGNPK
jgi:hypothetical protein